MTNKTLLQNALAEKDMSTFVTAINDLNDEVGSTRTREILNKEVLPNVEQAQLEWYWSIIASPVQLNNLIEAMSDKATSILTSSGLVLGKDFSFSIESDRRRLHLSKKARICLKSEVPEERQNTLRLLIHEPL